ncbi:MAG: M20/M25/M40 family metallo-hydrolase [Verrucomicrobiales bacterium]|nr:M20/M25/M40 family metallo-hydrolase [Verrucomicrobiales bacterium]
MTQRVGFKIGCIGDAPRGTDTSRLSLPGGNTHSRARMDAARLLTERLAAHLPDHLEFLREMVGINSYTGNAEGVNQLARVTADRFSRLGFVPALVPHRDPSCGHHLVATRPGKSSRTIALISHLDTVFPPEEEARNDFHWLPEGDRIYGPGTTDIKGGTAMMHLVLSSLRESDPDAFEAVTWKLLWNSSEETLSQHFAEVARDQLDPASTLAALVFEAEGWPQGRPALVVARKGRATFRVTVEGRGSHAGAKHPRGANAITQLGRLVDRIAEITDYSRHRTVNVGVIHGGVAVNRVPHLAIADVEMRAFSREAYQEGVNALLALNGPGDVRSPVDGHPCQVRVEILAESPPWPRNPGTDRLFAIWKSTADELGRPLDAEERGGLSDGNWICDQYPTLDGLGPHGDNDHCSERSADGSKLPEYIHVPSIVPKAVLNVMALRKLITTAAD